MWKVITKKQDKLKLKYSSKRKKTIQKASKNKIILNT